MTTLRYKFIESLIRLSKVDRLIGKAVDGGGVSAPKAPQRLQGRSERVDIDGHSVWIIHPQSGPADKAYVHFHGGGYVLGLMGLHFFLAEKLADLSGVTIILPDYPLAPKADVKVITDFANQVFEYALTRWEHVKIGGGSAGGNLALALSLHRKEARLSQAEHILLMSPWVDLEMAHPANDGPSREVCFRNAVDLRRAAKLYAGDMPVTDPCVSPCFANLSGLAPMSIFTGDVDLLHTDILAFSETAKDAGVLSKLAVYGELGHIFMLYPTPDRVSALIEMGNILRA